MTVRLTEEPAEVFPLFSAIEVAVVVVYELPGGHKGLWAALQSLYGSPMFLACS